jgi:hypothetical protein
LFVPRGDGQASIRGFIGVTSVLKFRLRQHAARHDLLLARNQELKRQPHVTARVQRPPNRHLCGSHQKLGRDDRPPLPDARVHQRPAKRVRVVVASTHAMIDEVTSA